ncbi:hypothetical protein QU593_10515 [Rossellomorea marisflavi]|uniref:hypothetical protein n=1 Tax=Rossellomorea marisflavi TaxID=189381 RepID=UPI0025AF3D6C|nr:hypothetical protein [Rossellomorea marisflavi]WJV20839.1 hypothetical protein QU593_10515 [Rossellomorea marisflavi]
MKKPEFFKGNNKKNELIEKVKKNSAATSQKPNSEKALEIEVKKYKDLYKRSKKELEKEKIAFQNYKDKEHHNKNFKERNEDEIESLKKRLYEKTLEKDESVKELQSRSSEYALLEAKYLDLKEELNRKSLEVVKILEANDSLLKKNELQKKMIKKLNGEINYFETKQKFILMADLEEKDKTIDTLIKRENKLTLELSKALEEAELLRSFNPEELLEKMVDDISIDNHFLYSKIIKLHRMYRSMSYTYYMQKKNMNSNIFPEERFGFVFTENDDIVFEDTDKNKYKVSSYSGDFKEMAPAHGMLNEGEIVVKWFYDSIKEMESDKSEKVNLKKKRKSKSLQNDQFEFEHIGNFKVLIVASKDGHRLSSRLTKHGIDASWISAYEKSPRHVKSSMASADIVILCIDSIPHYVHGLYENDENKFQFMNNPNENTIIIRIKHTAKVLGLIEK